ncbi:GNAT family N-acetyltransferase [Chengkuizengella axinellae]|uniref:GNAT family N-acetyltransferase n=1 Tax=Chengkuizengella axinellae TaxID=3064388 RepID=A0ABT9J3R0_9BACL|nr:GNAT family N-acetyltransferase [Chengkuizengella sp. 2205SS18-9]MDP5276198.1 GNAT family N-acetyltransferase [Chengkuizengella sp. 2205SS18-9]
MNIRLLESSDAKKYWDLRLEALKENPEAFAQSYDEAIKRENPIEGVAKNISSNGNFTFGAFKGEELVGVVTLLQETSIKLKHRANILGMYVSPQMRGLSIGEELLLIAIKKAKSIETLEKVNLTVVTTNVAAKNLYEKLGFKIFGLEEQALKVHDEYYDENYMVLILND